MTSENESNKDEVNRHSKDLEEVIGHVRYVHHKVDQITDYLKDVYEILREIHDATATENGISWYDLYGDDGSY